MKGDDGIAVCQLTPPLADKAFLKAEDIPIEGDSALHVGGVEDVLEGEWSHGRVQRLVSKRGELFNTSSGDKVDQIYTEASSEFFVVEAGFCVEEVNFFKTLSMQKVMPGIKKVDGCGDELMFWQ